MQLIKKELTRKIQQTKPGLAKKEIVEQSGSLMFKNERLTTDNDEISVSVPLAIGFEGAVSADIFCKALKSAPTATIELTVDDEQLVMKSGEMVVQMKIAKIVLPIEDIPHHKAGDWVALAPDFREKLKQVAGAASKNLARPVLCCIHMRDNIIEATDNYRIIRSQTAASLPAGVDLLIPKKSIPSLLKSNPTALAYGKGWASFQAEEDVVFSCRVLDGVFPDIEPALTRPWVGPIHLQNSNLADILARATHFAEEDSVGDPRVVISAIDDLLVVEAGQNGVRFTETCKIAFRGRLKFQTNPVHLKDALAMKFDRVFFARQGTSIHIKFEDESVTYLVVCNNADSNVPTSFK